MPCFLLCFYSYSVLAAGGPLKTPATTATIWAEDFTLPNGTVTDNGVTAWSGVYTGPNVATNRFAVNSNEFRVNNITVNGTGTWLSDTIDIAGKTNVTISVDIRSGVLPGGTLDDDNSEHYDYLRLYYRIDGGPEIPYYEKRGAINSNNAANTTITVAALNGASLQVIVKARATATDEFYYFDNVRVTGESAVSVDATAAVSGPLTCSQISVTLSGSSTTPGVSYNWSGPGGFTAATQQATTIAPGNYTLTVTDASGNTGTATVTVTQDIIQPAGVSATAGNVITCYLPQTPLTGTAATPGVTYHWSGPDGFSAVTATAAAQTGGVYTFTVTNPVNGCTASATVTVVQNNMPPANVTAVNDGPLTCTSTGIITGSTATAGVDYFWTGPNDFIGFSPAETITEPGEYVLTVTDLANGCSDTAITVVLRECRPDERRPQQAETDLTTDREIPYNPPIRDYPSVRDIVSLPKHFYGYRR